MQSEGIWLAAALRSSIVLYEALQDGKSGWTGLSWLAGSSGPVSLLVLVTLPVLIALAALVTFVVLVALPMLVALLGVIVLTELVALPIDVLLMELVVLLMEGVPLAELVALLSLLSRTSTDRSITPRTAGRERTNCNVRRCDAILVDSKLPTSLSASAAVVASHIKAKIQILVVDHILYEKIVYR